MKYKYWAILILICGLAFNLFGQRRDPISLDEILDHHIEAMGGMELWSNLETYTLHQSRPNGMRVINTCRKPDEFRIFSVLNDRQRIKSFDGREGFVSINGSYEAMRPGEEIEMKEEPEFYEELVFARQLGHQLEYLGKEKVDDVICHKVNLIKSTSDTQSYWLNSESFLIYMTGEFSEDTAHDNIYYKTKFFDFQNVEGYLFPFKLQLIASDNRSFDMLYDSIFVNEVFSDNHFQYQPTTTIGYYRFLKDQFAENKCPGFTFKQETVRYDEDGTIRDTSIWSEYVQYPNNFKIEIGDPSNGNSNLWRNDSVYIMRADEIVHSGNEYQASLLLKNGYFYYDMDDIKWRLDSLGVNYSEFHKSDYNGLPVYVVGAIPGDLSKPQVWYHAKEHYVIRRFDFTRNNKLLEVRYSKHQKHNGCWIEGQVDIYIDDELRQYERYFDIDASSTISSSIFDPF